MKSNTAETLTKLVKVLTKLNIDAHIRVINASDIVTGRNVYAEPDVKLLDRAGDYMDEHWPQVSPCSRSSRRSRGVRFNWEKNGGRTRARTWDLLIKRQVA